MIKASFIFAVISAAVVAAAPAGNHTLGARQNGLSPQVTITNYDDQNCGSSAVTTLQYVYPPVCAALNQNSAGNGPGSISVSTDSNGNSWQYEAYVNTDTDCSGTALTNSATTPNCLGQPSNGDDFFGSVNIFN